MSNNSKLLQAAHDYADQEANHKSDTWTERYWAFIRGAEWSQESAAEPTKLPTAEEYFSDLDTLSYTLPTSSPLTPETTQCDCEPSQHEVCDICQRVSLLTRLEAANPGTVLEGRPFPINLEESSKLVEWVEQLKSISPTPPSEPTGTGCEIHDLWRSDNCDTCKLAEQNELEIERAHRDYVQQLERELAQAREEQAEERKLQVEIKKLMMQQLAQAREQLTKQDNKLKAMACQVNDYSYEAHQYRQQLADEKQAHEATKLELADAMFDAEVMVDRADRAIEREAKLVKELNRIAYESDENSDFARPEDETQFYINVAREALEDHRKARGDK